ncbi:glycosyltransferase family 2 protein [Roseomonas marmotae]|uniref:Glycosyltransferase family 2 protein n=1 Tax=Roseomonas marmotae TaxID=2768161 RepID=A0ABS3KJI5_9PROT|nr:glycosyltransferase family A protein [Roseomonas marmotae]MBO1076773.1 glycosyltransferase family 2 protein [Roseomonas marmotae]QTI78699.1 glycosyltransferase family 2 protein [Roseomonas marmotae]
MNSSISVVVPTYNRAELLPATLDAILAQTLRPAEVIVVDDGSTDDTPAVLARYEPRVRVLRIANSGDLVARNEGLAVAKGDLVAFCDSDDLWRPGFLATMAGMWREEPHLRVAFSDFVIIRDGVWEQTRKFAQAPAGFWDGLRSLGPPMSVFDMPIVRRLLDFQPFFPSAMMADRRFLLGIGGWDTSVSRLVGCDFATALRLAEHAPFGILQQPLVGIRKHAGNHSADVQAMNLGDAKILERVLATRPSLRPYESAVRASIAKRRMQALDTAFVRQDFSAVREIAAMLPRSGRPLPLRVKAGLAAWPASLRGPAGATLLSLGSLAAATRRLVR